MQAGVMTNRFKLLMDFFCKNSDKNLLEKYKIGLERETLRTDSAGVLAKSPHPKSLGSPLKNSYISTDFSESQVELITPAFSSIKELNVFLNNLHAFLARGVKNEHLWPLSMPCRLPKKSDIPIAEYGTSDTAMEKVYYRRGLVERYGTNMQLISGIHYNFSFSNEVFEALHHKLKSKESLSRFVSDQYFHITRNYLHFGWIITYLFGSSPLADKSYFSNKIPKGFKKLDNDTYCLMEATSLRMSAYGYYNKTKCQHTVSLDNLDDYIKDLEFAVNTPCKSFEKLGLFDKSGKRIQLNTHLMQIPSEHYTRIRPKAIPILNESPIEALKRGGISYLEIRSIDIDPTDPVGITKEKILFVHLFLIFCLFKESHSIKDKTTQKMLLKNQDLVGVSGNKEDLILCDFGKKKKLKSWILEILEEMLEITDTLAPAHRKAYKTCVMNQIEKVEGKRTTPSKRLIENVMNEGFLPYCLRVAKEHKKWLLEHESGKNVSAFFAEEAMRSFEKQKKLEQQESFYLKGYEDMELSTQVLLRECQKRGVSFEILDRQQNVVRLFTKKKQEIVQQASITRFDNFLSYHLMENKSVTKKLLAKEGFNVPRGFKVSSQDEAMQALNEMKDLPLVIKPTSTNYGLGISFVNASSSASVKSAIEKAFSYGFSILIEEEIVGNEYRILIIGGKPIAVLRRDPANITADGKHSIQQLVALKNSDPKSHKTPKDYIKLEEDELANLKEIGLSQSSIPKKGQKIFLRKNSNISTGGDSVDVTDSFPEYFKSIAAGATEALNAHICGVDMIIPSLKGKKYSIIEMNYNPNLAMHYYPYKGKRREVGKAMLDFLNL
ncbi:MAG: Glutathione biosynthesis bifunctional protein GshAB [Chlamydiia bacterium]|nr:Glutathione biosynthesis bifunctional protein GshAB [Chlamydiia bacterium]